MLWKNFSPENKNWLIKLRWSELSRMISSLITSGLDINDRLYFLDLQNHFTWYCSHEIKRHLLLERKAMTNLDSVLKSRDIALLTKVHVVKAMFFLVVMYGCAQHKAEHRRIDTFKLRGWRRLLRVPWTARTSNQSVVKKINLWKNWC